MFQWLAALSIFAPSRTGSAGGFRRGGYRSKGRSLLQRSSRGRAGALRKAQHIECQQGSQFTSTDFAAVLKKAEIAILMYGKGAWRDNVFVERLWRSMKYEEVYLGAYKTVSEARAGIGRYLTFYNSRRPHSSRDRHTPDQAHFNVLAPMKAVTCRLSSAGLAETHRPKRITSFRSSAPLSVRDFTSRKSRGPTVLASCAPASP